MSAAPSPRNRIVSLDQFRGYTVAGMFVVNFLGGFAVTPALLKHHNTYCSYADTIMPQFLFAVGFAFRLTFGRRARTQGLASAYFRAARRLGGLILLALVIYSLGANIVTDYHLGERGFWGMLGELFKRQWFQTLMHIAVTSLWIMPVIRSGVGVRIAFMIVSAGAHMALSSWFNFTWVNTKPYGIDGGPLGFLTWTIPAIVGTLACDAVASPEGSYRAGKMLAWSVVLMVLGYALSCATRLYDVPVDRQLPPSPELAHSPVIPLEDRLSGRDLTGLLAEPPFVPPPGPAQRQWNYWMMSQRSGSLSYLTFAAGLSLAVFVLFHLACDRLGWQVGPFRTLGTNALAAYILHGAMALAVRHYLPGDAAWWNVTVGFIVFFGGTYLLVWLMEKRGILLRM